VLDEASDPPMGTGNFRGNVAAHCIVMGHFTVSCAKAAEPIDMPFWTKTRVGARNHVSDVGAKPQGEGQFSGVVRPFKSIGNLRCNGRCSVAAKGIM